MPNFPKNKYLLLIIILSLFFLSDQKISFGNEQAYLEYLLNARVLFNAGKYRDAIGEYKKAESIKPQAKVAILNQALIYKNLGLYHQAIDQYTKLLKA